MTDRDRDEQAMIDGILRHAVTSGPTDASERIAAAMWAAEMLQHLAEPVALIGRGKPITVTEYKELDPSMRAAIEEKAAAPGRDGVTILLVNPEGEVTLGKPMIFMVTRLTRDRVAALEKLNLRGPKVVQ